MSEIVVEYPIKKENVPSRWTPEYKVEWNREYRKKVKDGKIKPVKRGEPSKWDDPAFRKAYDESRKKKLAEQRKDQKMNAPSADKRPNYTDEEKAIILQKILDDLKQGKDNTHPHFELTLKVRDSVKRHYPDDYKKKHQEESESIDE